MSVTIEFSDEEFAALYAALDPEGHYWRGVERLDWTAYDAAKARIAAVGRATTSSTSINSTGADYINEGSGWVRVAPGTWTKE